MECVVCGKGEENCLHCHHVIPQAYGGTNGQTVMICSEHHNMIHKLALKLTTGLRKGKGVDFRWPDNHGDENVAKFLVSEIVSATLSVPASEKKYKVTLEFNQTQRDMLDLLKQEFGTSSLVNTVYSCLTEVYASRFKA